jgi:ribonuclease E
MQEPPLVEPAAHVFPPPVTDRHEIQPPQAATPAAADTAASEPSRRRSTVREPAPQALRHEGSMPAPSAPAFTPPSPAVEPVVSGPAESESSDRPRRSGWWSRRVLGKG